jgi:negative regulator of flagellin synthesis FlgM
MDSRTSTPRTQDPEIRRELIERIRREIAAGTYETPEKWEIALQRLLQRLQEE